MPKKGIMFGHVAQLSKSSAGNRSQLIEMHIIIILLLYTQNKNVAKFKKVSWFSQPNNILKGLYLKQVTPTLAMETKKTEGS
jgi:hypothetical protein